MPAPARARRPRGRRGTAIAESGLAGLVPDRSGAVDDSAVRLPDEVERHRPTEVEPLADRARGGEQFVRREGKGGHERVVVRGQRRRSTNTDDSPEPGRRTSLPARNCPRDGPAYRAASTSLGSRL